MSIDIIKEFEEQVQRVIPLLEEQYKNTPTSMLELIIKRYKNALNTIVNTEPSKMVKSDFFISGSVRAYLDSASDYMNPILDEMYKAEKILENIFD